VGAPEILASMADNANQMRDIRVSLLAVADELIRVL